MGVPGISGTPDVIGNLMDRPSLNPVFTEEPDAPPPPRVPLLRRLLNSLPRIGKVLCFDLFNPGEVHPRQGTVAGYLFRAVAYRILFIPALICGVVLMMVHEGTHPSQVDQTSDPASLGLFFRPLTFNTADGAIRDGWLIPVLDARAILDKQDQALRIKSPAVVLIHDITAGRQQMLPLVRPLHQTGYAVAIIGLHNPADRERGTTFGLREYSDVLACIQVLRQTPGIDPNRIAILGIGAGASAAVRAAGHDPRLAAVILDHPIVNSEQLVRTYISPPQPWLKWLNPLCHWAFEVSYRVNAEDIDMQSSTAELTSPRTLLLNGDSPSSCFRPDGLRRVNDFLATHLRSLAAIDGDADR